MNVSVRLLAALLLASAAANAVQVYDKDGAKLIINVQLQPWIQVQEDFPTPNVGEQFFLRRVRLIAQGQFSPEVLFLINLDQPNWGRNGDFNALNNREFVQDAWIAWHPTESLFVDFGLLLLPISRHTLQSTTTYTAMDVHGNIAARLNNTLGFRDLGVSLRGWALDKRIGFRFGAYNGARSTSFAPAPNPVTAGTGAANPAIDRQGVPRVAGFINFNLLDSEEGAWLYNGLYFGDKKVLSIGAGGDYQAGGAVAPYGITDHKAASLDLFFDYPLGGDSEVIVSAVGYRFFNGTGSANTGYAGFVDLGFRWGMFQPFVSYEFFNGDSCDTDASGANVLPCTANTNEFREASAGVNIWIKRNVLHINTEIASTRSGNFTLGQPQGPPPAPQTGGSQKHNTRFSLGATMFF